MTTASEAGLDIHFTLDGVNYPLPNSFEMPATLRQSESMSFNGMVRIDVPYDGAGMPDQPDRYEWSLDYNLSDIESVTVAAIEDLRTSGGVHLFSPWKKRKYRYTARSGQQVFYLPRPDAFSKSYAGHTSAADKAVISVNGTNIATVNYLASVSEGTVVAAGEASISNEALQHPESGKRTAVFKLGTAPLSGWIVRVEYYPLFYVCVREVTDKPFQMVGREDKTLRLVEVSG